MTRRFRRALLRHLGFSDRAPMGPEALFTERTDPSGVGRQLMISAQIGDVVAWLERSGWAGCDRGYLQQVALYLLQQRANYEQQGVRTS